MTHVDALTLVCAIGLVLGAATTRPTHPDVTLSHDGRQLAVSFAYESTNCRFDLAACSTYARDAVITVHNDQGQQQQQAPATLRTFCSREQGKRASVTLRNNSEVDGFFECDGRLFDFFPRRERRLAETWREDSLGAVVAASEPSGNEPRQLRGARELEEEDGDYEIPEIAIEGEWHTPPASFENVAALEEWRGQTWFPGCYAGDSQPHRFTVGLIADVQATVKHGSDLTALIETIIARTSFVYENQLNIRIEIGSLQIFTSSNSAPSYAKDCPAIHTRLNQLLSASGNREVPLQGVTHVLTGCGTGRGTVGVAYVGTLCSTRGYNTGVNQLHSSMSWVTFAHELGHNFGGAHSFEDGQGRTGGIMDYGNGKLNGEYQFNTKYRRDKMCQTMNNRVGRCNGHFNRLQDVPTPSPTTATPSPTKPASTPSPTASSTDPAATPSPTTSAVATPSPTNVSPPACSYSTAACHATAERLNLDTSGGGGRHPFAGSYSETGCYYYTSGTWAGMLWYGLHDGKEVAQESELTTLSAANKARPDGTHGCGATQAPATPQPTQLPTLPPTPRPSPGCADKFQQCPNWVNQYCADEVYGAWMFVNCRLSCDACQSECADEYISCPGWKDRGFCERRYVAFMQTYCKKSCDVCNVEELAVEKELQFPDASMPVAPPEIDLELVNGGVVLTPCLLLIIASEALHVVSFH